MLELCHVTAIEIESRKGGRKNLRSHRAWMAGPLASPPVGEGGLRKSRQQRQPSRAEAWPRKKLPRGPGKHLPVSWTSHQFSPPEPGCKLDMSQSKVRP